MLRLTAAPSFFRAKMRLCSRYWGLLARSGLPARGVRVLVAGPALEELVRQGLLDCRDPPAQLDPQVPLVQRARLEAQAELVRQERRDIQELLELLGPQAPPVHPVRKVPRAIREMLARQDLQDRKALPAQ